MKKNPFFRTQKDKLPDLDTLLKQIIEGSDNREAFWSAFLTKVQAKNLMEIGVFRGEFAAYLLKNCPGIQKYHMVDPWRHLQDWNKPANVENSIFQTIYEEMLENTRFLAGKRCIHRGETKEILPKLSANSLDFIYIDGDHTLRGITIDLYWAWKKIKNGGFIGGDDFTNSIWQHEQVFEPSMIFPYAVYFAESVGARIYALPYNQFLLQKTDDEFQFINHTKTYKDLSITSQVQPKKKTQQRKVYLHIPRTGGNSILSSLVPQFKGKIIQHDLRDPDFSYYKDQKQTKDEVYAFIRHPLDRALSAFQFLKNGGLHQPDTEDAKKLNLANLSFEEFVVQELEGASQWQIHFLPQSKWLAGAENPKLYYFHNFRQEFRRLCQDLGISHKTVQHLNPSGSIEEKQAAFTQETTEFIKKIYVEDFENFSFD